MAAPRPTNDAHRVDPPGARRSVPGHEGVARAGDHGRGDRWRGPLAELGGKGAFTKGVEEALLDGRADIAVHFLKDMPGDIPPVPGVEVVAYPRRDSPLDTVVTRDGTLLDDLLPGSRVGTSAPRRVAQLTASHVGKSELPYGALLRC